jgi:hypothetical protein
MCGGSLRARSSAKHDTVTRRLRRTYEHRLAVVVQQSFDDAAATAQETVHATARQAKRADRTKLDTLLDTAQDRVASRRWV